MDTQTRTPLKLPVVADAPAATSEPLAHAVKAVVDRSALVHRELLRGEFWRKIPSYKDVTEEQFLDHNWQAKNSVTRVDKLLAAVAGLVDDTFVRDAEEG